MNNITELALLDYFAANATDADIEAQRRFVPAVSKVFTSGGTSSLVPKCEPDDWRAIARYLHAEAMLKERAKRERAK